MSYSGLLEVQLMLANKYRGKKINLIYMKRIGMSLSHLVSCTSWHKNYKINFQAFLTFKTYIKYIQNVSLSQSRSDFARHIHLPVKNLTLSMISSTFLTDSIYGSKLERTQVGFKSRYWLHCYLCFFYFWFQKENLKI